MKFQCFTCGATVSSELPEDAVLRGTVECPECVEKLVSKLQEDCRYLLAIVTNTRHFTLPVPSGLDATFYATLSYEGDLAIAKHVEEIRESLLK